MVVVVLLCVLFYDSTYTTGKTPGCKGGPMEYAWWRDLFLVIVVVRFGLVMVGETCGGGARGKEVRTGDGEDVPR